MHAPCKSRFAAQIDELILGEPSARKLRRLQAHLADCPDCQARYNRVVLAGRLLQGGPQAISLPSDDELARIGRQVMARTRLVPDAAVARRGALRWVAALASAAALAAIVVPLARYQSAPRPSVLPTSTREESSQFQARGGERSLSPKLGVRAFCISTPDGQPPQVSDLVPPADTDVAGSCGSREVLKFAYTNRSELGYLFLVGVDEKHEIRWYLPHPPGEVSVPIKKGVADEPIERAVRLAVNHLPGRLRVFALFSAKPISSAQVQQAVARVRAAQTPLARLKRVPIDGVEQRSLLLRLLP